MSRTTTTSMRGGRLWALGWLIAAAPLAAAVLPAGFSESQVATGLSRPTAMTFGTDGRLFVAEQGGKVRLIKNGVLLPDPVATLSVMGTGEFGLLGVAPDPDQANHPYLYVYYTTSVPNLHNRLSRFTLNGDVAVPGSEVVFLDLFQASADPNHNGGAIRFSPDGKLYLSVGDNQNQSDVQQITNLKGKILRFNRDGSIPADNPFFSQATGNNRAIWALGVRNPFTMAVQPGTGRLFINDVGSSDPVRREEVNEVVAGANLGWPVAEGIVASPPAVAHGTYRNPLFAYPNGTLNGCSIIGGDFYNPATATFPVEHTGDYFFTDYCFGWIWKLDAPGYTQASSFGSNLSGGHPTGMATGSDGALYYFARDTGAVYKIQYTASGAPTVTGHPQNRAVSTGASAAFSITASGAAPLSYQWQRDDGAGYQSVAGATAASYTLNNAKLSDSGARFRCAVTNGAGAAASNAATLTVTANQPPAAAITQPAAGTLYQAGDAVSFAGTGTDPEQGSLGGAAFTWQVDLHHNDGNEHSHPVLPPASGQSSGSFTVPTSGESSPNVWFRITLTVTDGGGLTHTVFRDVHPRKATATLTTDPAGLQVVLDGTPKAAPHVFQGVVGLTRELGTPASQVLNGVPYAFVSWSNGGARVHSISFPASDTVYTAVFREALPPARPRGLREVAP